MPIMKHAELGLNLSSKRTRKREFLDEMNRVCRGRRWSS
jgi:IS5 family transposase